MLVSMTGFARAERALPEGRLIWELRTVNHRYLETTVRLPEEWRMLEPAVRETLAERVRRGKLEAQLRFVREAGQGQNLTLNAPLVASLGALCRQLAADFPAPASGLEALRWPGVVQETPLDMERLGQEALGLLQEALTMLDAGIRDCIESRQACRAYEFTFGHQNSRREGSFWADFLNFRRRTEITGWRFLGLVVVRDGVVLFRNYGGEPQIRQTERQSNPLGPLQPAGEAAGALLSH